MATWFVPLTTLLDAQGLSAIRPYAFASTAIAALVSPLLFGAIADRHVSPVKVLGWLSVATTFALVAAGVAIQRGWSPLGVLGLLQVLALVSTPSWSLTNTIVLARLENPRSEFGPVRAMGTVGWMAGCWLVSVLRADASTVAAYAGAVLWLVLAAFTWTMPAVPPPPPTRRLTVRERLGLDALNLLGNRDHRVVFLTAGLVAIPLSAFYPYTPPHLRDLGFERTSAWMSLGQVTEIVAMFALAALLARWRLKWIFACGLGFALIRYVLYAIDRPGWVLVGVSLHGLAFTLFFITAPIYLNERIDVAWRARAQALLTLMTMGLGNLCGYLGVGAWFSVCHGVDGTHWPWFWGGLAGVVAAVAGYFVVAYRGRVGGAPARP